MRILTIGMIVADTVVSGIEKIADPGELVYVPGKIELHVGGYPANVAIDLVKLGVDPGDIGVLAAIGYDEFGTFIESSLHAYGLNVRTPLLQKLYMGRTARNEIFVVRGEDRRFHLDPGANLSLNARYVREIIQIMKPDVVCIRPGYSGIDLSLPEVLGDLKDIFVFMDACRPYQKDWNFILPGLRHATAFHANTKEALAITGATTLRSALYSLLDTGLKLVCITDGSGETVLAAPGRMISQPAYEVDAVDPTGCGDAFSAGIVKKLLEGNLLNSLNALSDETCAALLMFAQAVGAAASTAPGTTSGVNLQTVEELIREQGSRLMLSTKFRTF